MTNLEYEYVSLSELRVPDFLIPHAFLAQCPYCYSSLEDLYFPINVVHYCPSCSMPINEVPPDEEIIYMMGGRSSIKKALSYIRVHSTL